MCLVGASGSGAEIRVVDVLVDLGEHPIEHIENRGAMDGVVPLEDCQVEDLEFSCGQPAFNESP